MANPFRRIADFIRSHNIHYHRRYDTAGEIYAGEDTTEPKFAYAVKGNYTISLGRVIGFFVALGAFIATLFSLVSFLSTSVFSLTAFSGAGRFFRFRRRLKRRRKKKLKMRRKAKKA